MAKKSKAKKAKSGAKKSKTAKSKASKKKALKSKSTKKSRATAPEDHRCFRIPGDPEHRNKCYWNEIEQRFDRDCHTVHVSEC
jgi:hypothetical protein